MIYCFATDSPRMESSGGMVGIDAGTTAAVVCNSQAFPPPTYIWSRGTNQLDNDGKYLITSVMTSGAFPYGSVLNITGFSIVDTGSYTCQATNDIGSSFISFNLTMNCKFTYLNSLFLVVSFKHLNT